MSSARMYCQTSSSVQFDSGKTRIDLALPDAGVVEAPELRPLVARVPGVAGGAEARRCAPWRGSSPRRAARRRRPRRSRTCRAPACSAFGLHHLGVQRRARGDRVDAARARPSWLMWTIRSSPSARAVSSRKRDHLAELPGRVDVQQREGRLAPDRRPSAPDAASRRSPCRSNRASPGCANSAATSRMM